MKKAFFSFLLLAASLAGSSQNEWQGEEPGTKLSVHAGPVFLQRAGKPAAPVGGEFSYNAMTFGISALLPKGKHLLWQAGLQFSNFEETFTSGKLNPGGNPADHLPDQIRFIDDYSYLDIPLGLRYVANPGKRLKFYIHPAVQANFLLTGKRLQTIVYKDNTITEFNMAMPDEEVSRLNFSAYFGAGIEYVMHPSAAFFLEPYFMTNLLNSGSEAFQGRFLGPGFNIGFAFRL